MRSTSNLALLAAKRYCVTQSFGETLQQFGTTDKPM